MKAGKTKVSRLQVRLLYAYGAVCQRCSRRIAEKDGDDGEVAASRSASERE